MTPPPLTRAELDRLEQLLKQCNDTAADFVGGIVEQSSYDYDWRRLVNGLHQSAPQLLALARQALEQQEPK